MVPAFLPRLDAAVPASRLRLGDVGDSLVIEIDITAAVVNALAAVCVEQGRIPTDSVFEVVGLQRNAGNGARGDIGAADRLVALKRLLVTGIVSADVIDMLLVLMVGSDHVVPIENAAAQQILKSRLTVYQDLKS